MAAYGEQYLGSPQDDLFTGVAPSNVAKDVFNFPARDYHPTQGRWLTPDPAGLAAVDLTNPQSFNRYAYVLGNPLALVDPLGLGTQCFMPPDAGQPVCWNSPAWVVRSPAERVIRWKPLAPAAESQPSLNSFVNCLRDNPMTQIFPFR